MFIQILYSLSNWIICFFNINYYSILYILVINPLSDKCFVNIFSHAFDCIFIFLFMPFEAQKCFHFDGIITYF